MNKVVKKIVALGLLGCLCVGFNGCAIDKEPENTDPLMQKSKEELISFYRSQELQLSVSDDRIAELEEMLKGVQGETVEKAAISEFSDGTGRLTLNSVDSIVKLPAPLEYPKSVQGDNASAIKLSDNMSIKPSPNWVITIDGTEIKFQHSSSEIYGSIKIGGLDPYDYEKVNIADLSTYMSEFFYQLPPSDINYKRLYSNQIWIGIDATTSTFIDEEAAQLRAGMLSATNSSMTYLFTYKGEDDPAKNELILNLLQTVQIMGNNLSIE